MYKCTYTMLDWFKTGSTLTKKDVENRIKNTDYYVLEDKGLLQVFDNIDNVYAIFVTTNENDDIVENLIKDIEKLTDKYGIDANVNFIYRRESNKNIFSGRAELNWSVEI